MSDDEYYADSPYDEFEEMLWDADAGPSLADDLAQHASYSPVWQDDPVGELQANHSDWEYYSDDYYDDDPATLKSTPANGTPSRAQDMVRSADKKNKKRKFEEFEDSIKSIATQSLRSAIQGTVWAKNERPKVTVYKSGQQEGVALLTDWRNRFDIQSSSPQSKSRKKFKRDESWANDLSLTDMGLTHIQDGSHVDQDTTVAEEVEDEEDESEAESEKIDGETTGDIMALQDETDDDDLMSSSFDQPMIVGAGVLPQSHEYAQDVGTHDSDKPGIEASAQSGGISDDKGTVLRSKQKADRGNLLPSPQRTHSDEVAEGTGSSPALTQDLRNGAHHPDESYATISERNFNLNRTSTVDSADGILKNSRRKRKVSISSDNSSATIDSRPSRRAKHVASDKLKELTGTATRGKSNRKARLIQKTQK